MNASRSNTLTITGDAMARPMIETLDASRAWDLSSMVGSSSAAIFSPTVKDRFSSRFPNLMIIDAIGSSESGVNGMAHGKGQATHGGGGPTVGARRIGRARR